jgi:hypothetical protein
MADRDTLTVTVAGTSYACDRWATAVLKVVVASEDPTTMAKWGRLVGASVGTIATWCKAAHASPKRSLELGRVLRALRLTGGTLSDLQDVMDIVEPRTVRRLVTRCGVGAVPGEGQRLGPGDFLAVQTLISNVKARHALIRLLDHSGVSFSV